MGWYKSFGTIPQGIEGPGYPVATDQSLALSSVEIFPGVLAIEW